ncbi:MAG TPA: hypothetical protein ENO30_02000 [Thermodesulfobium narugense]|nr:hypothetical protein [Thermodesulfobium narugense]
MKKVLFVVSVLLLAFLFSFPFVSRALINSKLNHSQLRIVYSTKRYSLLGILFSKAKIYLAGNYLAHFDYLRVGISPFMYIEAVGMCGRDYMDAKFYSYKTVFFSRGMDSYCLSYDSNIYFSATYKVILTRDGIFGEESFNDLLVNGSFFKRVSLTFQGNRGYVVLYCDSSVNPDGTVSFVFSYDVRNPIYNKVLTPVVLSCQNRKVAVTGNILTPLFR